MLRSFRVQNHKSIRDEAELLLMPSYDKTRPVVPVAAIFGANASGKSNLLDALRWMRKAVRTSFAAWEPDAGVPRSPFRLSLDNADRSSTYVVEVVINDVRHTYGFVVDSDRVCEEWLYEYPNRRKRTIFEREADGRWTFGTNVQRGEVEVLRKLTRDNALFLSVAGHSGLAAALPVYQWFHKGLAFHEPGGELHVGAAIARLEGPSKDRAKLVDLVRAGDFGITDIRLRRDVVPASFITVDDEALERLARLSEDSPTTAQEFIDEFLRHKKTVLGLDTREELVFVQGPDGTDMSMSDQSNGTLAWLGLLVPALTALELGAVLCVDEIDSSLHPRLTARLIELFRDPGANPGSAQLVFTTHDTTLLGTSFGGDILGRDEIWFVEKRRDGATTLFPLSDFHPRKDENTERRYLGGSYGAVPMVSPSDFRSALGLDPWADPDDAAA